MSLFPCATYPAAPDADAGVSFLSGERGRMPGEGRAGHAAPYAGTMPTQKRPAAAGRLWACHPRHEVLANPALLSGGIFLALPRREVYLTWVDVDIWGTL
jgi:hypothetical protein